MATIIIDPDRTWCIDSAKLATDPRRYLTEHCGQAPIENPLLATLSVWTRGEPGEHNVLASGLFAYLGEQVFVSGPAVITATSPAGSAVDLSSQQISGLISLLQLVGSDEELLAHQEQAAQTWRSWYGSQVQSS